MTALLETMAMSVTFGGLKAVNDVDLGIELGQIVGLIGANGAGKTTFIDGLTGFVPTAGRIVFDGREIDSLAAHRRARLGLSRTWQSLELFGDLTVRDNLLVAAERQSVGGFVADLFRPTRHRVARDVDFALDLLGVADLAERMPSEISQGQRKLVGAARAVAAGPRLVCLDEPAAGLDTSESRHFAQQVRGVRDAGITIFLVDHDMGLVLDVCDYVYVFEFGIKIAEGTPLQITSDRRVIESYLGPAAAEQDHPLRSPATQAADDRSLAGAQSLAPDEGGPAE